MSALPTFHAKAIEEAKTRAESVKAKNADATSFLDELDEVLDGSMIKPNH